MEGVLPRSCEQMRDKLEILFKDKPKLGEVGTITSEARLKIVF